MKVTKEQPKKLIYPLKKELEYSKGGVFVKTKNLYIKEFVYGELLELTEKFDDFLDEFEKHREKGSMLYAKEEEELSIKVKKSEAEELKDKIEIEKNVKKFKENIELMSSLHFMWAKKGGLSTSYLKKTLLPFLTKYIYCDEDKKVLITEKNLKELGLAQRGLVDFFLLGGLLPCYISLSIK